jgi:diguanylate cyclase (GGDEF)-like protein
MKRNIPDIIKAMNKTNDILKTTYFENQLACMVAAPLAFAASLTVFILHTFILHGNIYNTLVNSFIFLIFGILFEVILRVKLKINLASYMISILYALMFIFVMLRLYERMGPAIWMVACIQIVFAMFRIKRNMSAIVGTVIVLASLYSIIDSSSYQYNLSYSYSIPQTILMIIFLVVLSMVNKVSTNRYFKLRKQLATEVQQKNNIKTLYEEISITEEELRHQNIQLVAFAEEIKKRDEELYKLAYQDILTGLMNRRTFKEQLDLLISKKETVLYIVFIDVDSFKKINDTMGHQAGDKFIQHVASTLNESINEEDLLGRIGGDEFALIIKRDVSRDEILQEIETVKNNISQPIKINNYDVRLTASFGISIFPYDGSDASEILKSADMAMYKAKEMGKNNVQFFKKYMKNEMLMKTKMEYRLINALRNEEFFLVFQPQYYASGDKIRGFEVLVRWKSLELGIVSPIKFIPIAEETGLIISLGEWILRTACYKFKSIQEKYDKEYMISVNISATQLNDSNFVQAVKSILQETGLKPEYLELEVTESVFIESLNHAVLVLKELKKLGVKIALDDFGTGYSSLSYLKLLPIDTLKIDKSFVDDISADQSNVLLVGDIISLGHNLGVSVIAEGVEKDYQLEYLKNHSCDYIQGYIFSKPIEQQDLEALLATHE